MATSCSICRSPARLTIEEGLISGQPYRGLAARHGVSLGLLSKHRKLHVADRLALAQAAHRTSREVESDQGIEQHLGREALSAEGLLQKVLSLSHAAERILLDAQSAKKPSLALMAIGKAASLLELMGKVLSAMKEVKPEVRAAADPAAQAERIFRILAFLSAHDPAGFLGGLRAAAAEEMAARQGISIAEAASILQAREAGQEPPFSSGDGPS